MNSGSITCLSDTSNLSRQNSEHKRPHLDAKTFAKAPEAFPVSFGMSGNSFADSLQSKRSFEDCRTHHQTVPQTEPCCGFLSRRLSPLGQARVLTGMWRGHHT